MEEGTNCLIETEIQKPKRLTREELRKNNLVVSEEGASQLWEQYEKDKKQKEADRRKNQQAIWSLKAKRKREKRRRREEKRARKLEAKRLRKQGKYKEALIVLGTNKKKKIPQIVNPVPKTGVEYKAEYLHPLWKKRSAQIKERDDNRCKNCGININLHVHHLIYQFGFHVWEYEDQYLVTLCGVCHENAHKEKPIQDFYNRGEPLKKYIMK